MFVRERGGGLLYYSMYRQTAGWALCIILKVTTVNVSHSDDTPMTFTKLPYIGTFCISRFWPAKWLAVLKRSRLLI